MMLYLTIAIMIGVGLMDYISYKRGGLVYITGDALVVNRLLLDLKIKITDINNVDICIDEKTKDAYYSITARSGVRANTAKSKLGSDKYNHAGKLLHKCGVHKFNIIYK